MSSAGLVGLLAVLAIPGPVFADAVGTTTVVSLDSNTWSYGTRPLLKATVTADGPADGTDPTGSVQFYATWPDHTFNQVGLGTLSSGSTVASGTLTTDIPVGDATLSAIFISSNPAYAGSDSVDQAVTISAEVPTVVLEGPSSVAQHDGAYFQILVHGPAFPLPGSGTVKVFEQDSVTPLCSIASVSALNGDVFCPIPDDVQGTFDYFATFTSDDPTTVADGQSSTFEVTVTQDLVVGGVFAAQYSTFYPVKDGYRDSDRITGWRGELISVSIKMYNSANHLVTSVSIAQGDTNYSYLWPGKSTSGAILPEGKYKVVQTLTDAFGNHAAFTSYITISQKHLIWHSSSSTKNGSALTAFGHAGGGSVAVSTTSGSVRLRAITLATDWAGAGWQFFLPTAIEYKDISFRVEAKHILVVGGSSVEGVQNFALCPYSSSGAWDVGCFDKWRTVGNPAGTLAWFPTGTVTLSHLYGHAVRGLVSLIGGTSYIYKAQVTFSYATLGY